MKYRKVVIDGKEYLEPIEEKTAETVCETVECEAKEKEEPSGGEKFIRDTQDFFQRVGEGARDVGVKIGEGAKSFGERVVRDVKGAGKWIKEGAERLFAKDKTKDPSSKEARLIRLLPYMSKSETHEVALMILKDDELVTKIDLSCVLPFLTKEDCGEIFMRAVELGRDNMDIGMIVQYIDKSLLSKVVDGYLEGRYERLNIDTLYPFLSDKDIKRIFLHIVKG